MSIKTKFDLGDNVCLASDNDKKFTVTGIDITIYPEGVEKRYRLDREHDGWWFLEGSLCRGDRK